MTIKRWDFVHIIIILRSNTLRENHQQQVSKLKYNGLRKTKVMLVIIFNIIIIVITVRVVTLTENNINRSK